MDRYYTIYRIPKSQGSGGFDAAVPLTQQDIFSHYYASIGYSSRSSTEKLNFLKPAYKHISDLYQVD